LLAPQKQMELDRDLLARVEKPEVYLDFPVDVADYEQLARGIYKPVLLKAMLEHGYVDTW